MNLSECQVVLRPRSALETFDLSCRLLQHFAKAWMRLGAVVLVPCFVLGCAGMWASGDGMTVLVVVVLASPVIQAPFTFLASRLLFAGEVDVRTILGQTRRHWRRLVLLLLLWPMLALVGGLTLLLGLVPALVSVMFFHETWLLESVSVQRGASRAMLFVQEFLGKSLFGIAVSSASGMWMVMAFESLGQALVGTVLMLGTPFGMASSGDVTPYVLLGVLVAQPLLALYRFLLYIDLRTELEGWDLQVGLRAAAGGA